MKKKEMQEYKNKTLGEIEKKIGELQKKKVETLIEISMGKIKNVHAATKIKKEIAQLKTIINYVQQNTDTSCPRKNKQDFMTAIICQEVECNIKDRNLINQIEELINHETMKAFYLKSDDSLITSLSSLLFSRQKNLWDNLCKNVQQLKIRAGISIAI